MSFLGSQTYYDSGTGRMVSTSHVGPVTGSTPYGAGVPSGGGSDWMQAFSAISSGASSYAKAQAEKTKAAQAAAAAQMARVAERGKTTRTRNLLIAGGVALVAIVGIGMFVRSRRR